MAHVVRQSQQRGLARLGGRTGLTPALSRRCGYALAQRRQAHAGSCNAQPIAFGREVAGGGGRMEQHQRAFSDARCDSCRQRARRALIGNSGFDHDARRRHDRDVLRPGYPQQPHGRRELVHQRLQTARRSQA